MQPNVLPTTGILKNKCIKIHTIFVTENPKQGRQLGRAVDMCEEHKWGFRKYGMWIWIEFIWHRMLYQEGALGNMK